MLSGHKELESYFITKEYELIILKRDKIRFKHIIILTNLNLSFL